MPKGNKVIEKLKEIKAKQKELDKLIDDVIELASVPVEPPGNDDPPKP